MSRLADRRGIVTQARMTSTRLPGKVLLEVAGKTLLEHHLDRLAASGLDTYVATTTNAADDPIVEVARGRGVPVFRGSEHDVLARYVGCIEEFELATVVRVTSDCPLLDGAVIRAGVDRFVAEDDPDLYLANTLERSFPRGFDYEVFSGQALIQAERVAQLPAHREHVTPYLYENASGRTRLLNLAWPEDRSGYRVTLDTPADLELIRVLLEEYDAASLDCAAIIAILDAHPELVALNAHVEQKKLHG